MIVLKGNPTKKTVKRRHSAAGKRLIGAMREVQALEFARRITAIRHKMGLAQPEFARKFGLTLRSLQEWEQARRMPDQAVVSYFFVIAINPGAVERALNSVAA